MTNHDSKINVTGIQCRRSFQMVSMPKTIETTAYPGFLLGGGLPADATQPSISRAHV